MYADVEAFNSELRDQGAGVFAGGLHEPQTATVVRTEDGQVLTTDGPFAESKEQLGGFWSSRRPTSRTRCRWPPGPRPRARDRSRCARSKRTPWTDSDVGPRGDRGRLPGGVRPGRDRPETGRGRATAEHHSGRDERRGRCRRSGSAPFVLTLSGGNQLPGTATLAVRSSWSLATGAFDALAVQTWGAAPVVPVPGHRNSSGLRVSIHSGLAFVGATRPV